ncbi:MAG: hypothetical protein QE263_08055 [Vampirovibrionales bacterium]|nr:hypothetical protein [Vampirovibrionales bacterium]
MHISPSFTSVRFGQELKSTKLLIWPATLTKKLRSGEEISEKDSATLPAGTGFNYDPDENILRPDVSHNWSNKKTSFKLTPLHLNGLNDNAGYIQRNFEVAD